LPDWYCNERPDEPENLFVQLLTELPNQDENVKGIVEYLQATNKEKQAKNKENIDIAQWKVVCSSVSEKLESLAKAEDPKAGARIFVSIQQVSSILRTTLTDEVHSRLDVEWPEARRWWPQRRGLEQETMER
jgi:hypothetical protein